MKDCPGDMVFSFSILELKRKALMKVNNEDKRQDI